MPAKELIEKLNVQLNREVSTFLRYMLQAASIKGAQYESVRRMYLDEVSDEVSHAQYLSNQIVMLGGEPKLNPDLSHPPKDIKRMLENDAAEESHDVINYISLAKLAEKEQLIALKMKMEEQAADEDEHGHEMRRLLSGIC
jgi:bacterioferritin (cytochrome b1)